MTTPHLDDEQLSLLLDGDDAPARAHLDDAACERCRDRLDALARARDVVASATVPPLPLEVLDALVGTALDASPAADVVPLAAARSSRRRLTAPPPAWLLGAAAALAALVGVAGLVRATGSGDDQGSMAQVSLDAEDESTSTAGGAASATGAADAAAAAPFDPEVVSADLADQDDPAELALTLNGLVTPASGSPMSSAFSASRAAGAGGAGSDDGDTDEFGDAATESEAAPSAPTTTAPADRARCRAQADEIGAGRFAALLSTATLRWKGQPAEVLVYRLAEPSTDPSLTRQALVLSRPDCALLADPRF